MWLNPERITPSAIKDYQSRLLGLCPNHVVIDGLFNSEKLEAVLNVLRKEEHWQTQRHTYLSLYVDHQQWNSTDGAHRFVQRDAWQRPESGSDVALTFLQFLRSDEFMRLLARIFKVALTDKNVLDADLNSNYFRLSNDDFVGQHADVSPGREVCLLLYLNKHWHENMGGELVFSGNDKPVKVAPLYNRCVLFDPSSKGSEHWVEALNSEDVMAYRYNVTSWYWSE